MAEVSSIWGNSPGHCNKEAFQDILHQLSLTSGVRYFGCSLRVATFSRLSPPVPAEVLAVVPQAWRQVSSRPWSCLSRILQRSVFLINKFLRKAVVSSQYELWKWVRCGLEASNVDAGTARCKSYAGTPQNCKLGLPCSVVCHRFLTLCVKYGNLAMCLDLWEFQGVVITAWTLKKEFEVRLWSFWKKESKSKIYERILVQLIPFSPSLLAL